jgi:hypothetical protein
MASAQTRDGKLKVVYVPPKTQMGKIWEASVKSGQYYEKTADILGNYILWPRDVLIVIGEIGTANCFYLPDKHRIHVGYEMYDFILQQFSAIEPQKEAIRHTFLCMDFIFNHEMGHCLVGELDLPITGREEDAADDMAAVSFAEHGGTYGPDVAFAAAQFFELMGRKANTKDLPFWDEHSLDKQRFFNILAIFYGSNPNRYSFIEKLIPAQRLARCGRDYKHKARSWDRILNPHLRTPKGSVDPY